MVSGDKDIFVTLPARHAVVKNDDGDIVLNPLANAPYGDVKVVGDVLLGDNYKLKLGTGADLNIYHSGNGSAISHDGTGNFFIDNTTDDAFTDFRCDSGSGGIGTYLRISGELELIQV